MQILDWLTAEKNDLYQSRYELTLFWRDICDTYQQKVQQRNYSSEYGHPLLID